MPQMGKFFGNGGKRLSAAIVTSITLWFVWLIALVKLYNFFISTCYVSNSKLEVSEGC